MQSSKLYISTGFFRIHIKYTKRMHLKQHTYPRDMAGLNSCKNKLHFITFESMWKIFSDKALYAVRIWSVKLHTWPARNEGSMQFQCYFWMASVAISPYYSHSSTFHMCISYSWPLEQHTAWCLVFICHLEYNKLPYVAVQVSAVLKVWILVTQQ